MLFCPGVYEHAATFVSKSPYEVSRDVSLLEQAHRVAWERYQHSLIVVGIDVYNLEPEAFGAVIHTPSGNNMPSLNQHPCEEVDALLDLDIPDIQEATRIHGILEVAGRLKDYCADAEVVVPVCGPMALANGLVGMTELLMGLVEDPEATVEGIQHCLQFQWQYLDAIQSAGLKPVIFESGTTPPLLPVSLFESIEIKLLKELFDACQTRFQESPHCIIGGDSAPIAEQLLSLQPGYVIAPSETDQDAFLNARKHPEQTHVRINMSATLLVQDEASGLDAEIERVCALADGHQNVSIGCGVVPFETRPETLLAIREKVSQYFS